MKNFTLIILKVCSLSFIITYCLILISSQYQQAMYEKNELSILYDELYPIVTYYDTLKQRAEIEKTYQILMGHMKNKTSSDMEEIVNKQEFSSYELGFKHESVCDIVLIFEPEESVVCDLTSDLKFSGNLLFKRNKDKTWSCSYSGNKNKTPSKCIQ